MSELVNRLTAIWQGLPAKKLPLAVALIVFVLIGLVLFRSTPQAPQPSAAQPMPPSAPGATASPAGRATEHMASRAGHATGLVELSDFRVTIPQGWQRRPDLEDQGPGTKLFLEGPQLGAGQIYIGIDVYPLPRGMTLDDFIARYSSRWGGAGEITPKPATLCGKPARMLTMTDGKIDKLFLVSVRGDRGFVVGMFGPAGQSGANVKAFSSVVNTFQFFE